MIFVDTLSGIGLKLFIKMNLTINSSLLLKGMNLITHVIPAKVQSRPALSNVHFHLEGETLVLSSTDLEIGMKYRIPVSNVIEGPDILLPAHEFNNIIRVIPDSELRIEVTNTSALILGVKAKYKLPVYSSDEFPEIPYQEGEEYEIDASLLSRMVDRVAFAMNKVKNRQSLDTVILFLRENSIESVATDRIRLAYFQQPYDSEGKEEKRVTLPQKALPVLKSLLGSEQGKIKIIPHEANIIFKFENGFFISRQVDVQVPTYREVFDRHRETTDIIMDTEGLIQAMNQVSPLIFENSRTIVLSIEKDLIRFMVSNVRGEVDVELPVVYDGEPMKIGINPEFVLQFLREIHAEEKKEVKLKLPGVKKPVIFYSDENYVYFMAPSGVSA